MPATCLYFDSGSILFGLKGSALIAGAVNTGADRTTADAIEAYLDQLRPALDVDGNGTADALTDGLLIIRYLFGLRDDALIVGAVAGDATRTSASQIEEYIGNLMP